MEGKAMGRALTIIGSELKHPSYMIWTYRFIDFDAVFSAHAQGDGMDIEAYAAEHGSHTACGKRQTVHIPHELGEDGVLGELMSRTVLR